MKSIPSQSIFGRKDNEIPFYYNGNIDLNNRKVYAPPGEDYIQTEESMSFDPNENDPELRGKFNVAIPRIVDGKPVGEGEAIDSFFKTGEHLGVRERIDGESDSDFYGRTDAEDMATHNRQDQYYNHGNGRTKNPKSMFFIGEQNN